MFFFSLFQHGPQNLDDVTHEQAVAALKATPDKVVLIIVKAPYPTAQNAPSSPQPCKFSYLLFILLFLLMQCEFCHCCGSPEIFSSILLLNRSLVIKSTSEDYCDF